MPKVIEVVYTAGVLKPLEKIDLQEGETVEIEIKEKNHRKLFLSVGYGKVLKYLKKILKKQKISIYSCHCDSRNYFYPGKR